MSYWFDILIIGFTLLLGLKGIVNGLIKEVFGIIGLIGGVFLAAKFKTNAALFINDTFYQINNTDLAQFFGFLAILICVWILAILLGNFISKLIKLSGLGFLDRLGGFAFGAAKIFLIFAILIFCVSRISFLNDKLENFSQNSHTIEPLKRIGSFIMNQELSENIIEKLNSNLEEVKSDLNATLQGEN